MRYDNVLKPMLDLLVGCLVFLILLPFFLILMVLLSIYTQGQPFFIQQRVGKNHQLFNIIKFRTMNNLRNEHGALLPDEQRLTWVGKWVRKTSLDEIPQLINVIKGEMSIIGPRPLLVDYLPLYSDFQKRRHLLKPGITGWVGVNGRNSISWEEKFKLDVWYVDNISFALDIKILRLTVKKVLKSEGINSNNAATMEKFKGTNA
jgi:lipopolysaccharide/colanic/teichoic acid biosynthesis glycosyltransferase